MEIHLRMCKGEVLQSHPDEYFRPIIHTHWSSTWLIRPGISPLESIQLEVKKSVRQISVTDCTSANLKKKSGSLEEEAVNRLGRRVTPANAVTCASLLRQCADAKALSQGKRLHAQIVRRGHDQNIFLGNLLVHMYGSCGSAESARAVFDRLRQRNAFSWNIMIAAYAHNGHVEDARSLFDKMPQRDVVSWTAMITAYAQNGHGHEALQLFKRMELEGVNPNKITFRSVVDVCASLASLAHGKEIHASIIERGFESDVVLGNTLINMYGKCGSLADARRVFDKMLQRNVFTCNAMITAYAQNGNVGAARVVFDKIPQRNVVSWTAMIAAYAQNGQSKEALEFFQRMDLEGVKPDKITFVSVLDACASLVALTQGKVIHALIVDGGFDSDVVVATALVNMYGKCGCLDVARSIFDKMSQRNLVSWTAMIAAYAQNGCANEALDLFRLMHLEGLKPNKITMISILCTCSHAGLLDDGWHYLVSMSRDHAITPTVEHYRCMVDLIGRAGQLCEADDLINTMPFEQDAVTWMTLLGACRIHGDVERGARAAEHVFELDPENAAPYVLLSNIYAAAGRQDYVAKMRMSMEDWGIRKHPGCISTEVKDWVQ